MPRLFLESVSTDNDMMWVTGDNARYLTTVLRCKAGDAVVLFDAKGMHFNAQVKKVGRNGVVLDIKEQLPPSPAPVREIVLVQGILKGKKMDFVIQKAVELGVGRIVPLQSERAVVRQTRKHERWQKIAQEAARQSGRTDVPTVESPVAFSEYFKPGVGNHDGFIFWEDGGDSMRTSSVAVSDKPLVVAVGPEGGFTSEEVEAAQKAGLAIRSLGSRILRAETAALSALTVVQFLLGEMG